MAGAAMGDGEENPVGINVTPLVDVIFCLCVFFMISFKFKQLEGKFDSWLPKGKGTSGAIAAEGILDEVRVAMWWDENAGVSVRQIGQRRVSNDDELAQLIKEGHDAWVRQNKPDTPVTIDAEARVPWSDVITVMNLCKRNRIDKIEFALGAPPPAGGASPPK
jgi:biopolymer transport protein ExbD